MAGGINPILQEGKVRNHKDECLARVDRVVKDRAGELSVGAGSMYVAQADFKAKILLPQPFQSAAILLLPVR